MTGSFRFVLLACLVWLSPGPVHAQSPKEIVGWIYQSFAHTGRGVMRLAEPGNRDLYFSPRMARFFAANATYGDNLSSACLTFGLEVPGNDFVAAEILQTLRLTTEAQGARRVVHAEFQTFGQPARVSFAFTAMQGRWRIDDIAGQGWRLSDIPCQPAAAETPTVQVTSYCFMRDTAQLIVELDGSNNGSFDLEIWSANGHFCGAGGTLRPTDRGWISQQSLMDGSQCRIELEVTPDKGIRIRDLDNRCRVEMCGARATMDGVTFSRAAQVDCALVPRDQR